MTLRFAIRRRKKDSWAVKSRGWMDFNENQHWGRNNAYGRLEFPSYEEACSYLDKMQKENTHEYGVYRI